MQQCPWPPDERTEAGEAPFSFHLAGGSGWLIAVSFVVVGLVPRESVSARLVLVGVAVAVFAAASGEAAAAYLVAGLGWLLSNGFLVNQFGELSWQQGVDIWRVGGLLAAAAVGLGARRAYDWVRDVREQARLEEFLDAAYRAHHPADRDLPAGRRPGSPES